MNRRLTLTVSEAAQELGICPATAYHYIAQGRIPHVKIGTRIAVPIHALDRWLDEEADRSICRSRPEERVAG